MTRTPAERSLSDPIFGLTSDHLAAPVKLADGQETPPGKMVWNIVAWPGLRCQEVR